MKKLISILLILISISVFAQREDRHEKIKALKVSYITEQLDLSKQEAEKFWPVYNAYQKKLHKLRLDYRNSIKNSELNEQILTTLIDDHLKNEMTKAKLLETLVSDLKPFLSSQKVWKLIRSEEGFRRKLINKYRQRNNDAEAYRRKLVEEYKKTDKKN